jgi:hypothetical protein
MAKFTVDSKLKDLLKDPAAAAVLESYFPGMTTSPRIKMASAFTFRKVAAFPQLNLPQEKLAEIDEKLQALG